MTSTTTTSSKKNLICIFFLLLISVFQLQCVSENKIVTSNNLNSGDVIFDENEWLEFRVGDMPLVIAAPHGGTINPDQIQDRTCSGISTVRDRNAAELAFEMETALMSEFGVRPYIVASHISRKKVDLNRGVEQAACGNAAMEKIWNQYHEYLEAAVNAAVDEFGSALFIDLHGHGHEKQRLELGYLLDKKELRDIYDSDDTNLSDQSSLSSIVHANNKSLKELLMGENAFGSLMAKEGIPSVPSMDDAYPLEEDPFLYFSYTVNRYTSAEYPAVSGWMIEANYRNVRDTETGRNNFARGFSKSVMTFINQNLALNKEIK